MVRRRLLRRVTRWCLVAAGIYFATVYAAARLDWVAMGEGSGHPAPSPATPARVAGAIHVHAGRSHDAIGTEAELARAARAAGLDFVFLADHRDVGSHPAEWERTALWEKDVLLVRGQEIRVEGVGKVLVDRLDTAVVSWTGGMESFLARVERDAAFTVVAHPRGRPGDAWRPPGAPGMDAWEVFDFADVARRRLASPTAPYHLLALAGGVLTGRAGHNWLRLYRDGFRDPGVAAFDSLWAGGGRERPAAPGGAESPGAARLATPEMERAPAGVVEGVARYGSAPGVEVGLDPAAPAGGLDPTALDRPGPTALDRPGPTAVGGLDMHPKGRLPGGRLFPDYASALRTMINHVALDAPPGPDPVAAARALGAAIRRGDVFVSFGDTEGARGFRMVVTRPGSAAATTPGVAGSRADATPAAGESEPLPAHVPPGGTVRMTEGLRLEAGFATDPGRVAYRVVRDGREVGWWRGPNLSWAVAGPGVHRIELHKYSARVGALVWNLRPWIFVNPVLVRPPST